MTTTTATTCTAHHMLIEAPSYSKAELRGVCKYCGFTRTYPTRTYPDEHR